MSGQSELRLNALKGELRRRLRGVCAHWPDDQFETMIEQIANITIKYDRALPAGSYDRRSTDRLIADLKEVLTRSESSGQHDAEPRNEER